MIVDWIDKMFKHSFEKQWFLTYWAFDIHGVIFRPNYRKNSKDAVYYPMAKETLQLISKRSDIVMIMFTSSYPEEIKHYYEVLKNDGIIFKYINENPDIDSLKGNFGYYENKFYYNVMFEDKAGFDPEVEWHQIYSLMTHYEKSGYLPDTKWSTKY
jgi:hypothetical protein